MDAKRKEKRQLWVLAAAVVFMLAIAFGYRMWAQPNIVRAGMTWAELHETLERSGVRRYPYALSMQAGSMTDPQTGDPLTRARLGNFLTPDRTFICVFAHAPFRGWEYPYDDSDFVISGLEVGKRSRGYWGKFNSGHFVTELDLTPHTTLATLPVLVTILLLPFLIWRVCRMARPGRSSA